MNRSKNAAESPLRQDEINVSGITIEDTGDSHTDIGLNCTIQTGTISAEELRIAGIDDIEIKFGVL